MTSKDPNVDPEVSTLRRSLGQHRRHLDRHLRSAETYGLSLQTHPSTLTGESLKEDLEQMHQQLGKIKQKYERLKEVDPDHEDDYEKEIDDIHQRTHRATVQAQAILHAAFPPPAPTTPAPAAPAPVPKTMWKPNRELRPEKLTRESNPAELRHFIAMLRTYFDSDDVSSAPPTVQRGFLFNLMDSHLRDVLDEAVLADPNIVVFGDAGLVDALRDHFNKKYPLFVLQLSFLEHKQVHGQKWTEAALELRQKYEQASLGRLMPEQLLALKYIHMTSDKKLREKLTCCGRALTPTVTEILTTAQQYEADLSIARAVDESTHGYARRIDIDRTKKKKSADAEPMTKERLIAEKRCFRCGSKKHRSDDCPKKDSLSCTKCKKDGHTSFVCTGGAIPKSSGRRPPTPHPSRAASPKRTDDEDDEDEDEHSRAATVMVRSLRLASDGAE